MGHTKGPWNCTRNSAAGRNIICAENAPIDICVLSNRDKTLSEIDANARLIAGAPELLESLEILLAAFTSNIDIYEEDIQKAKSAIKKAKGES